MPNQPRLHLDLPDLKWPLYWELKVSNSALWIDLKKRPFGLRRNAIMAIASDFISHDGKLTQEALYDISVRAHNMVAGTTPADKLHAALAPLVNRKVVKVVLDR